jgi:hypothetical protein
MERPLSVKVDRGQLVIRIGINTLAFCAERCPRFYDHEKHDADGSYVRVTDKAELAKDIARALQHEQEDGTTPLHILLDDAIEYAYGDGSLGFQEEPSRRS